MDVKTLKALLKFILYGGSRSIDPIHFSLIDAVSGILDDAKADIVRDQLNERYRVQFQSDGRINRIYFDEPSNIPIIPDSAFADKLFKVELFVDGKKCMANVIFLDGRIFAVEMKLPRKVYKDKPYRVGKVAEGNPKNSFTNVIDRAAHGKETETNP